MKRTVLSVVAFVLALVAPLAASAQGYSPLFLNWQGPYSSLRPYWRGNVVTEAGTSYMSLQDGNIGQDPASTASAWMAFGSSGPGANLAAPGPIGGTTPSTGAFTTVTAQSVQTTGTGGSGFTVTPNATPASAPTNSIVYATPPAVPTPYAFWAPTNVTDATASALPMQCQYVADVPGPPDVPAHLLCALTAVTGTGLPSQISAGTITGGATGYYGISYNGSLVNTGLNGSYADNNSTTDPNQYFNVPTGGKYTFEVANTGVVQFSTGTAPTVGSACGSVPYILLTSGDGKTSYCDATAHTWSQPGSGTGLPSQIIAGTVTGGATGYYGISYNGSLSNTGLNGSYAKNAAGDPAQYFNVPTGTGAGYNFEVANASIAQLLPTGLWTPVVTPADTATCTAGTYMGTDGSFMYVCSATNTVKRVALVAY